MGDSNTTADGSKDAVASPISDKLVEIHGELAKIKEKSGSPFRDWIDIALKTVIAGLAAWGTYYLATRKEAREEVLAIQAQTNADVELLLKLVHGDDADRAIGYALANVYAGDRVPRAVAEAVRAYIGAVSTRSQAAVNNEVLQAVPAGAQSPTPVPAIASNVPIRVYFQYKETSDQARVDALAQSINGINVGGKRVVVPPTEHVASAPAAATLRCFRKEECGQVADDLLAQLKANGAPKDMTVSSIPGYENSTTIRPFHYEVWLGPLPH